MSESTPPSLRLHHLRPSLFWVVPIIAAVIAIWLFAKQEYEKGPLITVSFERTNDLQPGKTPVMFRGLKVGTIEKMKLHSDFSGVDVSIRLRRDASALAAEGSRFWIVEPSIYGGLSSLETLIEGNYIAASLGNGPEKTTFEGLESPPADAWSDGSLTLTVKGLQAGRSDDHSPIFHRGLRVGNIAGSSVSTDGKEVSFQVVIFKKFAHLVREDTRFWPVPLMNVSAGAGNIDLNIANPASLLTGGLEFDRFNAADSPPAKTGDSLPLFPNAEAAHCEDAFFEILFANTQGLLAGKSQIRIFGNPAGLVTEVIPEPEKERVRVIARPFAGFDAMMNKDSHFRIIRPALTQAGLVGIETIFSGVYIDCSPGNTKETATSFIGDDHPPVVALNPAHVFAVRVRTPNSTLLTGAPVYYRGVEVGQVADKDLSPDSRQAELTLWIKSQYAPLIHENTKFWNIEGIQASLSLFSGIKVQLDNLETLALGGIAFATPEKDKGARAQEGHIFELSDKPDPSWLKWSPQLPEGPVPLD